MSRDGALDRLIGQVLAARYRILARVGAGAMGTVFRAEHVKVGRKLAVKVLDPQMMRNEKYRRRFDREAELAGRLHHPNVASVLDVGVTPEGLRYLVMEYAEGPTLTELIRQGPMEGPRAAAIARRLCDGLHHAHEHDLVHRDFKPDNVIVERDQYGGELPRILDFGIAISLGDFNGGERERLTTEGLVLGTPHYMAPEHASGQAIDHRVDLFALGVILYEMLTGRLPFEGSGVEIARAYLSRPIPPMSTRGRGVEIDPLLEALARALLVRSRDERLPSARATRELLDMIERDRPAAARALGVAHEARRTLPVSGAPPPAVAPRPGNGTAPPPVAWTDLPTETMLATGRTTAAPSEVAVSERPTLPAGPVTLTREAAAPPSVEVAAPAGPATDAMTMPRSALGEPARSASASVYEAPPAAAPLLAPAAAEEDPQRGITTWVEDERPRRRAAWIAAATVGVGICAAGVIALRANRAPAAEQTATAPAPTTAALPAVPTTPATPAPTPPAPAPSSSRPPTAPPAPPPTVVLRPPEVPVVPTPTPPTPTPTPTPPPPAPPTPPTDDPGTQIVAELYKTVGDSLKRLDATTGNQSTADLWPTYRRIHLGAALGSRDKRIEAHQALRSLEREIARRSR